MYLSSALHGQGTSFCPGSSGAPTECRHGTKSPSRRARRAPRVPMRVMIRMLTATYGESVSSTPMCAIGEPSGPMQNGMTYIVRPRMQPSKSAVEALPSSRSGSTPVVGRAGVVLARREQMKVRSSTRATSLGIGAGEEAVRAASPGSRRDERAAASTSCSHRRVVLLLASRRTSGPDRAGTAPRPRRPRRGATGWSRHAIRPSSLVSPFRFAPRPPGRAIAPICAARLEASGSAAGATRIRITLEVAKGRWCHRR